MVNKGFSFIVHTKKHFIQKQGLTFEVIYVILICEVSNFERGFRIYENTS